MAIFDGIDTFVELQDAINQANTNGQADIFNITGSILLTSALPLINETNSLTINGGDFTLDGNNAFRLLFIQSGSVTLNNLTLTKGLAKGGDGAGGGAGMGGAIFILSGNVTANSITVSESQAIGGNGLSGDGLGGGGFGGNGGVAVGTAAGGGGGFGGSGSDGNVDGTGGSGGSGGLLNSTGIGGSGGSSAGVDGGGGSGSGGGFGGGGGGGGGGLFGGSGGNGGFGGGGGAGATGGSGSKGGDGGYGGGAGGSGSLSSVPGFGGGGAGIGNGGGAGMGGAIFIRTGSLSLTNSRFINNSTTGGTASGRNGSALGGAIFALNSLTNSNGNNGGFPSTLPTVTGTGLFAQGNTASGNDGSGLNNANAFGTLLTFNIPGVAPLVLAIARSGNALTNASVVNYTVTFSEPVTGVDVTDFDLTTTGLAGASVASVAPVVGKDGTYLVSVNTGIGSGTLRLNVLNNNSIIDLDPAPLAAGFTTGDLYTIDQTAPTVDVVDVTPDPRVTAVETLTIQFSEPIKNFDLADLSLTRDGVAIALTTATLTSNDNQVWTLGNLKLSTGQAGAYQVTVNPSNITDEAGNGLAALATDSWVLPIANGPTDTAELVPIPTAVGGALGTPVLFSQIKPFKIKGSNRADKLKGTRKADKILARSGNDIVTAGGGNDLVQGVAGNDNLKGGGGNDSLVGGAGNDTLVGQGGNDVLAGGAGDDVLNGGGGKNMYVFSSLNDGIDTILGFKATDVIDLRGILNQGAFASGGTAFARLSEFVKLAAVGSDTQVLIDLDGSGAGTTFGAIAKLQNLAPSAVTSINFVV